MFASRLSNRWLCGTHQMARGAWGLGLVLMLPMACAPTAISLSATAEPEGVSFGQSMERWTREGSIVSPVKFDTTLQVAATLRSPAFQAAYAARYAKLYAIHDAGEQTRVAQAEQDFIKNGVVFRVRLAAHDDRLTNLSQSKDFWRLMLLDDRGAHSTPQEITGLGTREQLDAAIFGEAHSVFSKTWLVRFPLPSKDSAPPRRLTLRVAGPEGKTDLVWQLE